MDKMQLVMKLESAPDEEASSYGATREGLSSTQVGSGRVTELLDLSKQLRNILLMRPIMQLEMNKLRIGGDESEDKGLFQGVDTHYLVLSVLDFMMEGTTINMGCTQDEVLGHLVAVSREMKPELTHQQAARVAEVVLDVLDNKAENFREFAYEYFCALERRPKLFRFRLVVYEPDLEDVYRYRPTPEGYLVYLGMLDLSPEDSQELMEKMLDMLISRGRFEAALEIAHQARKRFLEYRQLIRERLLQAYRAPGSVNWTQEMVGKLNAARSDISARQSEGQRMEESVRQSMQKAHEWKTRQDIERLLKMLESAGLMRTRLVQDITEAPEKYLEAQRAVFRARRPSGLPDLETRVFPQLLNLPTARLADAADHVISGLYPPQWPKVYDLNSVFAALLEQRNTQYESGDDDEGEIIPHVEPAKQFSESDIATAQAWLTERLAAPGSHSIESLLTTSLADGLSEPIRRCMVLMLFQSFARNETLFPDLLAIADGCFKVDVAQGDNLIFLPRENAS